MTDETTTIVEEATESQIVSYIQMFAEMMSRLFAMIKEFFAGLKGE